MREQTVVGSLLVFFTLPSAAAQETPRLAPCMCASGRTDMSRGILPRALTESRHGFRRHGGFLEPSFRAGGERGVGDYVASCGRARFDADIARNTITPIGDRWRVALTTRTSPSVIPRRTVVALWASVSC